MHHRLPSFTLFLECGDASPLSLAAEPPFLIPEKPIENAPDNPRQNAPGIEPNRMSWTQENVPGRP